MLRLLTKIIVNTNLVNIFDKIKTLINKRLRGYFNLLDSFYVLVDLLDMKF